MKRTILIAGLLALPATASANVGAPIAPGVGLELGLYLPGLILIEFLVLRLTLPLTWKQALACSTEWNIITTLVGFLWTVVAFAISVEIEERLARHSPLLAGVDRKRIHWTILAANLISYVPLWMFTSLQHQLWR